MTPNQAKKKFGFKGTKRLRRMWQLGIQRGRTPNQNKKIPNFNPMRTRYTKVEKLVMSYMKSANRTLIAA